MTKLQTENKIFTHETDFKLKIIWGFKNLTGKNVINLAGSKRTAEIRVFSIGPLEIRESSLLRKFLSHKFNRENNVHTISIDIPENAIDVRFEGEIILNNPNTGQREEILINYELNEGYFDDVSMDIGSFLNFGFTDLIMMIVCLSITYAAFNILIRKRGQNKDEFNENIINEGNGRQNHNYNNVYGNQGFS